MVLSDKLAALVVKLVVVVGVVGDDVVVELVLVLGNIALLETQVTWTYVVHHCLVMHVSG